MGTPRADSTSALPLRLDHRAVSVLDDRHSRPRHHQGRGGADVEGAGAVPAGAAGIEQVFRRQVFRQHQPAAMLAHDRGGGGEFVDRLALHAQGHEQRRRLGLAAGAA